MSIRYRKSRGSERKPRLWLVCLVVVAVLCAPFVAATMGGGTATEQQDQVSEQQQANTGEVPQEYAGTDDPADLASPGTSEANQPAGEAVSSVGTTAENPELASEETVPGATGTEDDDFANPVDDELAQRVTAFETGSATVADGTVPGPDAGDEPTFEAESTADFDANGPADSTDASTDTRVENDRGSGEGDGGGADGADGARGDGGETSPGGPGSDGDRHDGSDWKPLNQSASTGGENVTMAPHSRTAADTGAASPAPATTVADAGAPPGPAMAATAGEDASRPPFGVKIAVAGMILLGLAVAFRLARE
ncbi:hypothetical protein [Haloarchaeobius litoreus]|uniref:Uncharacterized protein n=1 Tax=Haloarchaeobius litoreus TaxID=755306 RepID=A0ABD6DJT7_9EURY|nr:hypothetical protein [Haloarchaeobius litoreus]